MSEINVDSKQNVYVVNGGSWDSMYNISSKLTLIEGTYEIRIKSGTFSFWSSGPQEPMVFLLIRGKFSYSKTNTETKCTWVTLNGLDDHFKLTVTEDTTIYAFFIDINTFDNRGVITLSCSPLT